MKTILCDNYQKDSIYHELLSDQKHPAITGVQLLTVSNLLRSEEKEDRLGMPLKLAHLLNTASQPFPIYRAMFIYPAFIQEILSFARECTLYQIDPDTLPQDTASEKELREILKLALTLPLEEKRTAEQYDASLARALRLEDLEIRIRFAANPFHARFLKQIRAGHPKLKTAPVPARAETIELHYARSLRQELEAAAQRICRENRPCAVVLTSYSEQYPVLRQVFARYGIPCSSLHREIPSAVIRAYTALAQLGLHQDAPSLVNALKADAFEVPCRDPLLSWLAQTLTSVSFTPTAPAIISELLRDDHDHAETMDAAAQSFFSAIQPSLDALLSCSDPAAVLKQAWQILRTSPLTDLSKERQAALAIMNLLNQTLPEVSSEQDAVFVLRQIESISVEEKDPVSLFCMVTDLSHPCDACDDLYVIGCSAKNYPGTPVRKGLFDEAYVSRVSGYPTLAERHALWNDQLGWIETTAKHVFYSYAASDYQGKEIQPAFEITSRLDTSGAWVPDSVRPSPFPEHVLNSETAHALYTREDGMIHSSISRIERYFYCPYSWFLQSGLRIREPMPAGLNPASIGNLQHAFLEHAVKEKGKQYTALSNEEIRSFLAPAFASLRALYPNEQTEISLTEERMIDGLADTLRILAGSEAAAPVWKPVAAEMKFDQKLTEHVQLNGVIDRMDESPSSVRVMDYKSSSKSLSEAKIKAGIQLQLLSYMLIAASLSGKRPAGVYYISMKPQSTSLSAGSFKTTNKNGVPMNDMSQDSVLEDAEISSRRIAGWAFEDPAINEELYAKYFTPGKGEYSFDLISACIRELYETFFREATSGRISVEPLRGACLFCDYKAVCRFHGQPGPYVPRVDSELRFKKGKGDAE